MASTFTLVFCFSTSIMVAQFLQKLTYEEVQIIVQELLDLAEKCKTLKSHEFPSESCHQLVGESCSAFFYWKKKHPKLQTKDVAVGWVDWIIKQAILMQNMYMSHTQDIIFAGLWTYSLLSSCLGDHILRTKSLREWIIS